MAVFAPIPNASVSNTVKVRPGFLASMRRLKRMFLSRFCIALLAVTANILRFQCQILDSYESLRSNSSTTHFFELTTTMDSDSRCFAQQKQSARLFGTGRGCAFPDSAR